MESKICSNCLIEKPCEGFYKRKGGLAGRHAQCKECLLKKAHENHVMNLDKNREYEKKYYSENKERRLRAFQEWKTKNPSYFQEYYHRKRKFVDAQKRLEQKESLYGADQEIAGFNSGSKNVSLF